MDKESQRLKPKLLDPFGHDNIIDYGPEEDIEANIFMHNDGFRNRPPDTDHFNPGTGEPDSCVCSGEERVLQPNMCGVSAKPASEGGLALPACLPLSALRRASEDIIEDPESEAERRSWEEFQEDMAVLDSLDRIMDDPGKSEEQKAEARRKYEDYVRKTTERSLVVCSDGTTFGGGHHPRGMVFDNRVRSRVEETFSVEELRQNNVYGDPRRGYGGVMESNRIQAITEHLVAIEGTPTSAEDQAFKPRSCIRAIMLESLGSRTTPSEECCSVCQEEENAHDGAYMLHPRQVFAQKEKVTRKRIRLNGDEAHLEYNLRDLQGVGERCKTTRHTKLNNVRFIGENAIRLAKNSYDLVDAVEMKSLKNVGICDVQCLSMANLEEEMDHVWDYFATTVTQLRNVPRTSSPRALSQCQTPSLFGDESSVESDDETIVQQDENFPPTPSATSQTPSLCTSTLPTSGPKNETEINALENIRISVELAEDSEDEEWDDSLSEEDDEYYDDAGQVKGCTEIKPWTKDIVNHFWWCCKKARNYEEFIVLWKGVLHHVCDEHTWATGSCHHEHLSTTEPRTKSWLAPGSAAHKKLSTVVLNKRWLKTSSKYLRFRKEFGMTATRTTNITDDDLDAAVREVTTGRTLVGVTMTAAAMLSRGIRVSKARVHVSLKRRDPHASARIRRMNHPTTVDEWLNNEDEYNTYVPDINLQDEAPRFLLRDQFDGDFGDLMTGHPSVREVIFVD
ncbi:hypothetical protein Bbelb_291530 [Branchiostoma belcheri]|nr:hypothetical protein Bbelb_291530 [Branchiostoma belcheri]